MHDSHEGVNCGWCNGPRLAGHWLMCSIKTAAIVFFLLGLLALIGVARTLSGGAWLGLDNNSLWHLATILFVLGTASKVKLVMLKQKIILGMMLDDGCGDAEQDDCCGGGGCSTEEDEAGCCEGGGCNGGSCGAGECGSGSCGEGECCKGLPDDQCCKKK